MIAWVRRVDLTANFHFTLSLATSLYFTAQNQRTTHLTCMGQMDQMGLHIGEENLYTPVGEGR